MRLPLTYAAASGCAAMLLFGVQPWAAKLLLPWFGGSAAVWLTSMLFFQIAVVVGYLYAHLVSRAPRALHVVWCLTAAAVVPITVAPHHLGLPAVAEVFASLTAGLGIVIVLVASTTPLLHTWLARDASDDEPYALYAASNAGSLAGLLAYPFVVEPLVAATDQGAMWGALFALAAIAVLASAFTATGPRVARPQPVEPHAQSPRAPWFLNAFIPASLLYGFTAFVTRDIAALPMIWVVPLSLYLLTFILTFARRPVRLPAAFAWAGPLLLYVTAIVSVVWTASVVTLALHLVCFSAFAMYFHGELSRSRPGSDEATAFYLWVSLGGVMGGVVNAVLAPLLFSSPAEYALTYGLALILIPANYVTAFEPRTRRALHAAMMVAVAIAFAFAPGEVAPKLGAAMLMLFAFVVALGMPALSHVMLAVFLGAVVAYPGDAQVVEQRRSFYGTHTVERRTIDGVDYVGLADGITLHGHERVDGEVRPLGYYHFEGPCAEVFADVGAQQPALRVALVGLGIGAMSLYSRPDDEFVFFELDDTVVELARTRFRSLAAAQGAVRIEVGDGRLGLERSTQRFDLIVVDAFSSDAIPTHLLTKEAFELYGRRLAPGGRLLLHTSNRYLDVDQIAIGSLSALGWEHRQRRWDPEEDLPGAWTSSWVVAAPVLGALGAQANSSRWQVLRSDLVWTDAYSSVLGAIRVPRR